jgi:hypothetical protein
MTSETGMASAANNDITTTDAHSLNFILPPFGLRLVGRKAAPVQRLGTMPSFTKRYDDIRYCLEHPAELECALDGFPDRIHPHSSRTVTLLRFQSPSKLL